MNDKRQKILDEAVNVFAKNNYYPAKTEEIAQNAGVSKGILFHYFETKENLYLQTLLYAMDVMEKVMFEVPCPNGELSEIITWSNDRKWLITQKYPEMSKLLISAMGGVPEKIRTPFLEEFTRFEKIGFGILEESVKKIPLKEGVDRDDVVYLINQLMRIAYNDTIIYFRTHPNTGVSESKILRERTVKLLELVQGGFRKES